MKLNVLPTITALAATTIITPALAVPPEDFGFPSAPNDTVLSGSFSVNGNSQAINPGILFGINVPAQQPTLGLQTSAYQSLSTYNGSFIVVMVDPDASYPQAPTSRFILHWLQPNTSYSTESTTNLGLPAGSVLLTNTSTPIVPYRRPGPPTNSSSHRYILYAFEQPINFTIPPAYTGYSNTNRTRFNLTNFVRDAGLGTPAAANYFYCSNQTGIDPLFVAQPGGSYPIGNGQAVTSGDPASTFVPTSTMMASGSGSAAATSATTTVSRAAAATAMARVTGVSGLLGAGLLGLAAIL